jgi:DNA polymerase kappa
MEAPAEGGGVFSLGAWSLKAGMSNMVHSREHIEAVIQRASRDSEFGRAAAKQDAALSAVCAAKVLALSRAGEQTRRGAASVMASHAKSLRAGADFSNVVVVVDLDAFFAGVAETANPALRGKAFAVGSEAMISAASYEARRYGVRSALPGFIARALCPQLLLVPSDWSRIEAASAAARAVLSRYDHNLSMRSVDEAVLDLTPYLREHGLLPGATVARAAPSPAQLAEVERVVAELRGAVHGACGVTCSAGIAPTHVAAKIASNARKPNGQTLVPFDAAGLAAFMAPLPLRAIPGVGRVSEAHLRALGYRTCADVVEKPGDLRVALGDRVARSLLCCALGGAGGGGMGAEENGGGGGGGRHSLSHETTFAPTSNPVMHRATVQNLCADIAEGLAKEGLAAGRLVLRVKRADFGSEEHGVALVRPAGAEEALAAAAGALLKRWGKENQETSLRLLGVRAEALVPVGASGSAALMDAWMAKAAAQKGAGGGAAGGGAVVTAACQQDPDILEMWMSQEAGDDEGEDCEGGNDGVAAAAAASPQRLAAFAPAGAPAAMSPPLNAVKARDAPSPGLALPPGMAQFLMRGALQAASAQDVVFVPDSPDVKVVDAPQAKRATLDAFWRTRS